MTTTTVGTDTSDWPGLRQFVRLERSTTIHGETTTTVSYAVASHPVESSTPGQLLSLWRSRWLIENRLFWVKDAVFREDHSRIRTGRAADAARYDHIAGGICSHAVAGVVRRRVRELTAPDLGAAGRERVRCERPCQRKPG